MNYLQSKATAWIALALIVGVIVLSMLHKMPWWAFIAEFFCFIGIFAHIASLYLQKMNRYASRKLDVCALVSMALAVIGFIVEYIILNMEF